MTLTDTPTTEPPAAARPATARPLAPLVPPAGPARGSQRRRLPRLALRVLGPLTALGLWQVLCTLGVFTTVEVASPVAVFGAARQLWGDGTLQSNLAVSLQRVGEGLLLGLACGVVLAVLAGLTRVGEDLIDQSSKRPGPCRSSGWCPWPSSGSVSARHQRCS